MKNFTIDKKSIEIFLILFSVLCFTIIFSTWNITIESSPKILFKTNNTDFLIGEEWCSKKMCFNISENNEFQYIIDDTSVSNHKNEIRISVIVTIIFFILGTIPGCVYYIFNYVICCEQTEVQSKIERLSDDDSTYSEEVWEFNEEKDL